MQNEFSTTFLPSSKYMFGTFINGNSNFNVFTFYVTLSLVQVQSYNLNREQRKVTLEIRNTKGKLSYLGFLEQERTRDILCL